MTDSWRLQREKGHPFLLRLLTWAMLNLGRKTMIFLLCPAVFYYFLSAADARRASRGFLRQALHRSPRWWQIYRHFLTFAIVTADRILFLAGREKHFSFEIHGGEIFERYRHQGCILLAAHFGSFDALRVMGTRTQSIPMRILLDIEHNRNVMNLLQRLDPELAAGVIDARTPGPGLALLLNECLGKGEMIGIMADRGGEAEAVQPLIFFDRPAPFPTGCWQLGAILQVPVIACFGIFLGGNRYALHFEVIAERLGNSRRERAPAIAAAMGIYSQRLQHHAGRHPYNWFNFYDFWQHDTPGHH